MLTPFPGTLDFDKWEETLGPEPEKFGGIPVTRHWLIPQALRPKVYTPHPVMGADEIRARTQGVWDKLLQPRRDLAALDAASSRSSRGWRSC